MCLVNFNAYDITMTILMANYEFYDGFPTKNLQQTKISNFVAALGNKIRLDITCESSASRNIKPYFGQ